MPEIVHHWFVNNEGKASSLPLVRTSLGVFLCEDDDDNLVQFIHPVKSKTEVVNAILNKAIDTRNQAEYLIAWATQELGDAE